MKLTIIYTEDGEVKEREFEDPEFAQVLCNVNEAAVDGETFTNVTEATYNE